MLTVAPWKAFDLRVTMFSRDAREWWDLGRRMGAVVRTDAGMRKWEKDRAKSMDREDPWQERGEVIDQVSKTLRIEGVDGLRLVRSGKGLETKKIEVDDGAHFHCSECHAVLTLFSPQRTSSPRTGTSGLRQPQLPPRRSATSAPRRSTPRCVVLLQSVWRPA